MKKILCYFLLIFSVSRISAQQPLFQVKYNIKEKIEKNDKIEAEVLTPTSNPKLVNENLLIYLHSNNSFQTSIEKTNITSYFDIENEMVIKSKIDSILDVIPLHSIIDFRIAEYKNRKYLRDILKAGGLEDALGDLANLESIFGIEDIEENIRNGIKMKNNKDTIIYKLNNEELVSIHYSKEKIPNNYIEAFSKYLTYEIEIHPKIKEDIIKKKLLPDYIKYNYSNVAMKTIKQFTLLDSAIKDSLKFSNDFNNKKFAQRNTSQMEGIIDSMYNYTLLNTPKFADSTYYFKAANRLSKEGNNLSGFLCLLEYSLSTGNQPANQFSKIVSHYETDSLLSTFVQCLNAPTTQEEAEMKIDQFSQLIELDIEFGYIMNIFIANYTEPIDENKAILNFKKALSENPLITGAWLDLGKIYANKYSYNDAWKCFEILLTLNSEHTMAAELIDRKSQLEKDFPNYFKSQ